MPKLKEATASRYVLQVEVDVSVPGFAGIGHGRYVYAGTSVRSSKIFRVSCSVTLMMLPETTVPASADPRQGPKDRRATTSARYRRRGWPREPVKPLRANRFARLHPAGASRVFLGIVRVGIEVHDRSVPSGPTGKDP